MQLQQTLAHSIKFVGVGVHTNKNCSVTLHPAAANTGIRFLRTDVPGSNSVSASPQTVYDTTLSTSLAVGDIQILTVEHLMSALWGCGIDNVLVSLTNEEVPILDGSTKPFVELIKMTGTQSCGVPRKYLRITEEIYVSHSDTSVCLRPYNGFKASYRFDHPKEVFNHFPKYAEVDFNETDYEDAVSNARSFGHIDELAGAIAINRCLGSSLNNAVGLSDGGVLNPEGLRASDEFARHKILDAIGDLYLLGVHVLGEFRGVKSGHTLNNRLARAVLRCPEKWEMVVEDFAELRVPAG